MLAQIWGECRKSLLYWTRNKIVAAVAFFPPLLLTFVFVRAFSFGGDGGFELAVVNEDGPLQEGRWGQRLIRSLEARTGPFPYFAVRLKGEREALRLFARRKTFVVFWIPQGFHQSLSQGQKVTLPVKINTIHEDLSKNLRLGIENRIYDFVSAYQLQKLVRPGIRAEKKLKESQELVRADYMIVGVLSWMIVFLGFFVGGTLAATEKDEGNFAEIEMSPAGPLAAAIGKTLATMMIAAVMMLFFVLTNVFFYGMRFPNASSIIQLLLVFLCLSFFSSFLGVQYGMKVGDFRAIPAPSILVSFTLWMISGAINPLEFSAGSAYFKYLPTAAAIRVMIPSMFGRGEAFWQEAWWVLASWTLLALLWMGALLLQTASSLRTART